MSECPTCGGLGYLLAEEEYEHAGRPIRKLVPVECPDCGVVEQEFDEEYEVTF